MKKFWFQMLGLVIIICLATYFAFNNSALKPLTSTFKGKSTPVASSANTKLQKLKITDPSGNLRAELNIEIVDTPEKRTKGLGYRSSLASDSGMLFIHEKTQQYTYWMKGMEFAIDFIWILDDKVVDVISNALPPIEGQTDDTLERYAPTSPVNRVLETNTGFVKSHNIQKGDKIIIEN